LTPHERNNFKAKLLHPSGFFLIKVGLLIFQIVLQLFVFSPLPQILGYAANIPPTEVIRLTNEKRAQAGLNPLKENPLLSRAALSKGTDMINNDYWAHVSPAGVQPWFFFTNAGYKYRYAGENLARDFSNATSTVDAWMASSTHRENLLSDKYSEIGIGVVEGDVNGIDTTIVVQFFGTRYADTVAEPIAQAPNSPPPIALPAETTKPEPRPTDDQPLAETEAPITTPGTAVAGTPKVLVSPFATTKGVSLAVVVLLLGVLVVDAFATSRRRIRRIAGRTFAHIAFLGMILAIILILRAGQIL